MASNHTENYGLCQWEATDQVLRTDFNADNAKVDAALKEQAAQLNNFALMRNCHIMTLGYSGDGASTRSHTFTSTPIMVNIMGRKNWVCAMRGCTVASSRYLEGGGGEMLNATWTGNTLRLSSPSSDASTICNWSGDYYTLIVVAEL